MIVGGWKLRYKKRRKSRAYDPSMKGYVLRNEKLSDLGYDGYKEYLRSEDWKKLRSHILERHPQCIVCLATATQVHHMSYTHPVLLGLVHSLLMSLCRDCHETIEFDGGEKRGLREANGEFFRLLKLKRHPDFFRQFEQQYKAARKRERKFVMGKFRTK